MKHTWRVGCGAGVGYADVDFIFSSLPSFDFDLDIVFFHPVFFLRVQCCLLSFGFCCDSFSIWYTPEYASWYVVRTLISPLYFCLRIRFISGVVCSIFCFYLFYSWGNSPIQSYWSLSCDDGLHSSDELIENNNNTRFASFGMIMICWTLSDGKYNVNRERYRYIRGAYFLVILCSQKKQVSYLSNSYINK